MARDTFFTHPKFRRLVFLLNIPEAHVLGLCEFLWSVAYASGNPEIGDVVDIELAAKWTGGRGEFCLGLLNCGGSEVSGLIDPVTNENKRPTFVDANSTSGYRYQIHDLYDHAPDYVKRRMDREADRVARGLTISEIRRNAVNSRKDRKLLQTPTSESLLKTREVTNGATPAPAPAPAPAPITPLAGNVERSNGRRAGVSFADPESEDPVKRLEGWELSGLGPVASVPEVKRALAEWILDLRARTPPIPPTPLGLREQISRLEGMGTVRALAAIKFSLAGQYKGICEDGSKVNGKASVAATAPGVSSSYTKPIKYGL